MNNLLNARSNKHSFLKKFIFCGIYFWALFAEKDVFTNVKVLKMKLAFHLFKIGKLKNTLREKIINYYLIMPMTTLTLYMYVHILLHKCSDFFLIHVYIYLMQI